ncbi:CHAT domain-containing protein [Streptomyces phaeochromogenes]|uniref:CHAT domain-containing protein n=1 Tax=Streptomyces phaeochromogenes TaxID=1923 RepID=UPI0033E7573A
MSGREGRSTEPYNRGVLSGAFADDEIGWVAAEFAALAGLTGSSGGVCRPYLSALAEMVADETDAFSCRGPVPEALNRLRGRVAAHMRSEMPDDLLHGTVDPADCLNLARLLSHAPNVPAMAVDGLDGPRIRDLREALHHLSTARAAVAGESAWRTVQTTQDPPRPGLVPLGLQAHLIHVELDTLLEHAAEYRPTTAPSEVRAMAKAIRDALSGLRRDHLELLDELSPLLDPQDPDLVRIQACRLVTWAHLLREDPERLASTEWREWLSALSVLRVRDDVPDEVTVALRQMESELVLKRAVEHGPATAEESGILLEGLNGLKDVWLAGGEPSAVAASVYAEGLIHAVVERLLPPLALTEAIEAAEYGTTQLDPRSVDFPSSLLVRGMARGARAAYSFDADDIERALKDITQALRTLPPDHPGVPNALMMLCHSLLGRLNTRGSIKDSRSALALLESYADDMPRSGVGHLVMDVFRGLAHVRFHNSAGADDADCGIPAPTDRSHTGSALALMRTALESPAAAELKQGIEGALTLVFAQALVLAGELPGRKTAVYAEQALQWAERSYALATNAAERVHRGVTLEAIRIGARGVEHIRAQGGLDERLTEYENMAQAAARSSGGADGMLQAMLTLIRTVRSQLQGTTDDAIQTLRAINMASESQPLPKVRTVAQLRLARALRVRGAAAIARTSQETLARLRSEVDVMPGLGPLLDAVAPSLGLSSPAAEQGHGSRADLAESRSIGVRILRENARQVLLQEGTADALFSARDAGREALEVAHWAIADRAWDAAVQALESGRALVLHSAHVHRDTSARLRAMGRGDLAESWNSHVRDTGLLRVPEYVAGDPGADLTVPSGLTGVVMDLLEADGALDGLVTPPRVADISNALAAVSSQALVYLLPPGPGPAAEGSPPGFSGGGALVLTATGRASWVPFPGTAAAGSPALDRYRAALRVWSSSAGGAANPAGNEQWARALSEMCDWASRTILKPVLAELDRHCPPRPDGRARTVLIPMDDLAAVPWAAVPVGRPDVLAIDRLVISYAPSARQFIAAAARPRPVPNEQALLVNGLTGPAAAWTATALLHGGLYPRATVLNVRNEDGEQQKIGASLLTEISIGAGWTMIDIAAHLAQDLAEPWRSCIHLGEERLRVDQIANTVIRAPSLVDTAGQANPGGVCVSLACCTSNLSDRYPDEGFTVAGAFLSAGASTVLGSLWPSQNAATAFVMLMFHHFMGRGHEPSEALRRAQQWMRRPDRRIPESLPRTTANRLATQLERISGVIALDSPSHWAGAVHLGR